MDAHFRSRAELALNLADVLARQVTELAADVVQIDEANISGHPEDAPWAAPAINRVLESLPRGIEKGVHVCFGNYGGQTVQKGLWRALVPFFNQLNADHLVLEFARRGYGELEVLRDVKPTVRLGIGVIDIKDNVVESSDLVASRIDQAVRVLGSQRVAFAHPDCGFWMLPRNVADGKMRALVAGRDKFLGTREEKVVG